MKKRTKNILIRALLVVALSLITCAGVFAFATETKTAGLQGELKEIVKLGEEVQVPEYYAEINGEIKPTNANIIFPSEKVYAGTKFIADEAGNYAINYLYNGKVVHTEHCKVIVGSKDLFTVNNFANVLGVQNYAYEPTNDDLKGVAVDVYGGANIEFNKEIAVSSLRRDIVLFEALVEPKTEGDADFSRMYITFTDANDPSSYFRVTVTDGHSDGNGNKHLVYINAGANGQTSGAYNHDNKNNPFWQTVDIYGTSVVSSFRAVLYNNMFSNYTLRLFYDPVENALYVARWEVVALVADFDDPVVFKGTEWSGFKSDTLKVSVSFGDIAAHGGRVVFNEIGGERLVKEEIIDDVAPTLTIDLNGESKAPNSTLGTQYSIFDVKLYDFYDAHVKVKSEVKYKNLTSGVTSDVSVVDGKFVTDKLGLYTIIYTATDYSGNSTTKEVSFECIGKAEEIVLTNVPADSTAEIFSNVLISAPDTLKAYGGLGNLHLNVSVKSPDGEDVSVVDNKFFVDKAGDYVLTYTATDYYGNEGSEQVIVTVETIDKTVFKGEISLPQTLIKGFSYVIPQISAKTCYNEVVEDCQIVYYVNGTKQDVLSFVADGEETAIKCEAVASDGTVRLEKTWTFDVVDGEGGKDKSAYFIDKTSRVQVSESKNTLDLKTSENSSVEFVNKLNGYAFTLGVSYDSDKTNFSSFDVVLSNAVDSSATITLKFAITSDGVTVTVPFGSPVKFTTTGKYFKFSLNFNDGIISDVNGVSIAYAPFDDLGNKLTIFEDGLYAKFVFNGIISESEISFDQINNQTLGYRQENPEDAKDDKGPEIAFTGEIDLKAQVGDTVTIYSAKAYDVLSQVKSMKVRVLNPAGEEVLAETDADRDFEITLTESGEYMIIYTAFDTATSVGNRTREISNIRVVNSTPPTLEVDFKDVNKKVGNKIKIPKITVSDDSGVVFYDVFLALPNGEMRLLVHSDNGTITSYLSDVDEKYPPSFKVSDNKFKLEQKGTYRLIVMAYDEYYNLTIKTFYITVK